jgi:NADP-dependent 3-hydroxy acid dehydrogenase YdfG
MHDSSVMLLTGAASGIGRHLAKALSNRGHRLLATDVNLEGLDKAANDDGWNAERVKRFRLDVRSPENWEQALKAVLDAFGRLDVLLNVAGYLKPGQAHAVEAAEVDRHFDINVKGVVHGTRVVAKHFVEKKAGHIVNVGSLASLAPVPGLCLYSASKFAVRGFSLATAQELQPHGVHVSLLMPDAVQTPMLDLQVHHADAALTFSGAQALTVEDIELALVEEILPKKLLELALPTGRGVLAKFALVMPGAAAALRPMLEKKGRAAQEKLKTR